MAPKSIWCENECGERLYQAVNEYIWKNIIHYPMYISKFRVQNYKSYLDSGEIELKPGFNVIFGQNNAGKTSLLEAMSLQFENKPHKSLLTLPDRLSSLDSNSRTEVIFSISDAEFKYFLNKISDSSVYLPSTLPPEPWKILNSISENGIIMLSSLIRGAGPTQNDKPLGIFMNTSVIGLDSYELDTSVEAYVATRTEMISKMEVIGGKMNPSKVGINPGELIWNKIARQLHNRIYRFKAERMNVSTSLTGTNTVLTSNASNLAEVLNNLQGLNPYRFSQFNARVKEIFPQIFQIAVQTRPHNQLEIVTWPIDTSNEREDLAISLSESGTGIGQVLAMLYVVMTSNLPQIIIIDEPQSFLHPGAARKLIEILKRYSEHQYIIATHSAHIISSAHPETIHLVKFADSQSKIVSIDSKVNDQLQTMLIDVGARLSDVFGADDILWVEGPTEEKAFPMIVEKLMENSLMGTKIVGVLNTGDIEGNNQKLAYDIYNTLSTGSGLVPPALAFIFDRERRNDRELEKMKEVTNGKMRFLTRTLYENYLLNAKAIHHVMNDDLTDTSINLEDIEAWIETNKFNTDKKYWKKVDTEAFREGNDWKKGIDAASFLEDIFKELSNHVLTFRKTRHSILLTEWIIENSPEDLDEVVDLLKEVLVKKNTIQN